MSIKKKPLQKYKNASSSSSPAALEAVIAETHALTDTKQTLSQLGDKGSLKLRKSLVKKTGGALSNEFEETSAASVQASSDSTAPILLAQTDIHQLSDASGTSTSASDLSSNENTSSQASAAITENNTGLSTAQMVGLGLLGVAAAGGITALAVSSSRSSSNGTNTSTPQTAAATAPQTPDITAPQIQSLSAHSSTRTIELTYSEVLDARHLPPAASFAVNTNGVANSVSQISVNGNVMTLTLLNAFSAGTLTLSYTDPTTGNDVNAIQDLSGNDATGFIQGIVADGYISGARIYIDTNGDSIAQESEYTGVTTNADGSFFLPNTLPNGTIIAVGGINIDTGIPQTAPLIAPAGSLVINPLTTLVQAIVASGISVREASAQVATALGLPDIDLTSYDPLAGNNVQVQKVAAQVNSLLILGASGNHSLSNSIVQSIANDVINSAQNNSVLDLSNSTAITTILAASNVSSSAISDVIAVNTAIQAASGITDISGIQSALLATFQSASGAYSDTATPATTIHLQGVDGQHIVNVATKSTASLTGITHPDTLVHLQLGAGIDRTVYSNAEGEWIYVLSAADISAIGQGSKSIEAWTVAPAGNTGTHASLSVVIDTVAPEMPVVEMSVPTINNASLYNDTSPTFHITAQPGLALQVKDGTSNYQTVTPDGNGSVTINLDNYQGSHTLAFRTVDAAGNFSELNTLSYNLDSFSPIVSVAVSDDTLSPITTGSTVSGNTTQVTFTFDQNPGAHVLNTSNVSVTGGALSNFSVVSTSSGKWVQTATFTADTTATHQIDIAAGFLSDTVGNQSIASSASIIVRPSILSADSTDTNIINAAVNLITDELEKLPFLADLAEVAFYLATHLTVTRNNTNNTFTVTYRDSADLINLPLSTDLGWKGLSFNVASETDLLVTLACSGRISGGTENGTFYFDTGPASSLSLGICADIPNDLALTGTMGPLSVTATNIALNTATSYTQGAARSDNPDAYLAATISLSDSGTQSADNKLTWTEIQTAFSTQTLSSLMSATATQEAGLQFATTASLGTGINVIDQFIPEFETTLVAFETVTISSGNATPIYTATIGLQDTALSTQGVLNVALKTLGVADKLLITPALSIVDFLDSPLPWMAQTYQAQDVPTPSGWNAINPAAWAAYGIEYAAQEIKEYSSELANEYIQDFYQSMDINSDGEVTPIDIARYSVNVADDLLLFAEEILGIFQGLIDTARDNPVALSALTAAAAARLGAMIGSVVPGAGSMIGGVLGGLAGAGASIYVSTHVTELQDFHDDIEVIVTNIQTTVHTLQMALASLQTLADKLHAYEAVIAQFQLIARDLADGSLNLGDYTFTLTNAPAEHSTNIPSQIGSADSYQQTADALTRMFGATGTNIAHQLHDLGIDLPFVSNQYLLAEILTGQTTNLITADLQLPSVNFNFDADITNDVKALLSLVTGGASVGVLSIVEKFADLNFSLAGQLNIDPNISFGLDTSGLNEWVDNGMALDWSALGSLADNFYLSDHVTTTPATGTTTSTTTDLNELTVNATLAASVDVSTPSEYMVGVFANLLLAIQGSGGIDLNDPNSDGKVRLSELWDQLSSIQSPLSIALDHLSVSAEGEVAAWIDFSKPLPTEGLPSILQGLASAANTVLGYTENRYTLDIPFAGQAVLIA